MTSDPIASMSSDKDIALIQKDVEYIKADIKEIKQSLRDLAGVYVPMVLFNDENRANKLRLDTLEKASGLWKWFSPLIASVLTATVTFLLISYLQHLK